MFMLVQQQHKLMKYKVDKIIKVILFNRQVRFSNKFYVVFNVFAVRVH